MKYKKADIVLPDRLIKEIQKYVQGEYIYVPVQGDKRRPWGETSGIRNDIRSRNENIRNKHKNGYKINDLAEEFFLSIDSIKKIIYSNK